MLYIFLVEWHDEATLCPMDQWYTVGASSSEDALAKANALFDPDSISIVTIPVLYDGYCDRSVISL